MAGNLITESQSVTSQSLVVIWCIRCRAVRIELFTVRVLCRVSYRDSSTRLIPEVAINNRVVQNKLVKVKARYSCTVVVTQSLRHQSH